MDIERLNGPNPMVTVPVEMPLELAALLGAQAQWIYSDRMQAKLMEILTVEQIAELVAAKVAPRPIIFPSVAVIA